MLAPNVKESLQNVCVDEVILLQTFCARRMLEELSLFLPMRNSRGNLPVFANGLVNEYD